MGTEPNLYYLHGPRERRPVAHAIEFVPTQQFLEEEPLCKGLWELVTHHFRTRSVFLQIWQSVRFVAFYRHGAELGGALLVTAAHNWQIDYVVVREELRGRGIAEALVNETVNQALARRVPYLMLTSRAGLRKFYEGACGFTVVGSNE
jgi:GNAT superfamily N-acetyltransferase